MKATIRKMSNEQLIELKVLDEQMDVIQVALDALGQELVVAEEVVNEIRSRIKLVKPNLVPLAEAKLKVVKR